MVSFYFLSCPNNHFTTPQVYFVTLWSGLTQRLGRLALQCQPVKTTLYQL